MSGISEGAVRCAVPVCAVLVCAVLVGAASPAMPASETIGPTRVSGDPTRVSGLGAGAPGSARAAAVSFAPGVLLRAGVPPRGEIPVRARTTAALADAFDRHGYRLDDVRRFGAVPRLFVATAPPDLSAVARVADRKALFIRIVLPLVLAVNETIAGNRARIERLRARLAEPRRLTVEQEQWLAAMFSRYDAPMFDFAELLRRVDVIVPSLAIAQSAEESGWGTSRFARKANALFGQRIFKGSNGLVPLAREPGARHRVRAFDHLLDSARAYAANLNSHPAYARFRAVRAGLRRRNRPFDGLELARTLRFYSERRGAYVATIRRIIRINRLTVFDGARLGGATPDLAHDSEG